MRRGVAIGTFVAAALAGAAPAAAKEFSTVVLVGRDGDARELRLPPRVIDGLFEGRTSARPVGGYVRVYPLDAGGHVGAPARFYPRTAAVCVSWNQAARPRDCRRAPKELAAALAVATELRRLRGAGTYLAELVGSEVRPVVASQLRVAIELAFDRPRLAIEASAPRRCLRLIAVWRGADRARRPRDFCLSTRGVFHRGVLYPLGPAPGQLAWLNRCDACGGIRQVRRRRVSALYPRSWHLQLVERHVIAPRLVFQISTQPGEDGASVSDRGAVVRIEELLPPLRTRAVRSFPPRPRRFELARFDRTESWPRGSGTRFRARGRAFSVWVAFGTAARGDTRQLALAALDSLRVR